MSLKEYNGSKCWRLWWYNEKCVFNINTKEKKKIYVRRCCLYNIKEKNSIEYLKDSHMSKTQPWKFLDLNENNLIDTEYYYPSLNKKTIFNWLVWKL